MPFVSPFFARHAMSNRKELINQAHWMVAIRPTWKLQRVLPLRQGVAATNCSTYGSEEVSSGSSAWI